MTTTLFNVGTKKTDNDDEPSSGVCVAAAAAVSMDNILLSKNIFVCIPHSKIRQFVVIIVMRALKTFNQKKQNRDSLLNS